MHQMWMGVDQARENRRTADVDQPRVRSRRGPSLVEVAERRHTSIAYRKRPARLPVVSHATTLPPCSTMACTPGIISVGARGGCPDFYVWQAVQSPRRMTS